MRIAGSLRINVVRLFFFVVSRSDMTLPHRGGAGEETLKRAVVRKLEYVLERQRKDASAPGGPFA